MSELLWVTVTHQADRVRFDFGDSVGDESYNLRYEEPFTPVTESWSDEFKTALFFAWQGVVDVELDEKCWWLSFKLRPGATLERVIERFVPLFAHFTKIPHVLVRM